MSSLLSSKSKDDDDEKAASSTSAPRTAGLLSLPSYGSCPSSSSNNSSPVKGLQRANTPPPWLSELLMSSTTSASPSSTPTAAADADADAENNVEESSKIEAFDTAIAGEDRESESPAGENIIEQTQETTEENSNPTSLFIQKILNMPSILSPLFNRILTQTVASDKLLHQYQLLSLLSINAKYAALGFTAIYLLFVLLLWLPLWLLSLLITEAGVYLFLLSSLVYGGRCLLRLLAFPGTNVRVYGEIENEFAKYSCKMLEGGAGALEDFARSIRAGCNSNSQTSTASSKARKSLGLQGESADDQGWELVDVPATYKRVEVYKKRILGVYAEVLHCLLEEGGLGYDGSSISASDGTANNKGGGADRNNNGFYRLGNNCKRNLCCETRKNSASSGDIASEGIQLDVQHSSPSFDSIPGNNNNNNRLSRYGNNPLVGDIGSMGNLTEKARTDGRELYTLLTSLLEDLSTLESSSSHVLRLANDTSSKYELTNATVSEGTAEDATKLIQRASELREFVSRIKLPSDANSDDDQEEEDVNAEAVRHRLEEQGGTGASTSNSTMGMVTSALQAVGSMIDPPPHASIFGLDVIRGTFLARYGGARQFWVQRNKKGGDGRLDVIMIPSNAMGGDVNGGKEQPDRSVESFLPLSPRKGRDDAVMNTPAAGDHGLRNNNVGKRKTKAVLYCNPNAGLVEVATGMGLTGGNVGGDEDDEDKEPTCWTEYYTEHGYDVYLFNYAGYGRSYGGSSRNDTSSSEYSHGIFGVLKRVFFGTFLAFKPSSESLKADAAVVARHLAEVVGVEELVIHGESIGGMAAAGAARALTAVTKSSNATSTQTDCLLICDRTFTNLEAVAQRLVGQWTGNAIRLLTPSWSTDVARDFLAAQCPKLVAQDCADEIIHDYSSLKSGLAVSGELTKGRTTNVGWVMKGPAEYRIADLDNVGVSESRLSGGGNSLGKNPPTWPADKRISWSEAYHFAACVKRIGKLATVAKRRMQELNELENESTGLSQMEAPEEGIEVSYSSSEESMQQMTNFAKNSAKKSSTDGDSSNKALLKLWNALACTDGLCGHPLGHSVKEGYDCTIAWLCCAVVYGGQVLAEKAERRWDKKKSSQNATPIGSGLDNYDDVFLEKDFDLRPEGYQWDEDELAKHPVPVPEVLSSLKENAQSCGLQDVAAELNYVIGMFQYMVSRLTSKENTSLSLNRRNGGQQNHATQKQHHWGDISPGCFLNLNCGHNNQYSSEEREKLIASIRRSCNGDTAV